MSAAKVSGCTLNQEQINQWSSVTSLFLFAGT